MMRQETVITALLGCLVQRAGDRVEIGRGELEMLPPVVNLSIVEGDGVIVVTMERVIN